MRPFGELGAQPESRDRDAELEYFVDASDRPELLAEASNEGSTHFFRPRTASQLIGTAPLSSHSSFSIS